ncbi:copper chaperone PCu(A)C [Streptomyces millisiae]|uniref:Copper chaperone PCu(A)C n=1 Tax=Streptomyces millisiae TaxID=3075542 RepID=A0ABU2LKK7_9ACTN|nr:copper chaperone PCu(A)C [Streptomyces sp. DSM 44918]MDT0318116.1 copper chaperone PCu(A)C [Streptomyces sp. DSM 44918]
MTRRSAAALLAGALTLGLAACSGGEGRPELRASGAYVPQPPTQEVAGAFLTIENTGDADDTLVSVSSDVAGTVEIHETVDNRMRQVDSLPVPAGGRLDLARGGNHVMLLDLSRRLVEGETVSLELRFETSDPLTVDVPVESATHTGE